MTQHTPGPWAIVDDGTIRAAHAVKNSDQMADYRGAIICDMKAGTGCSQWPAIAREHAQPEAEANARLIAAAPETAAECNRLREINAELLAAVKEIWATCDPAEGNAKADERAYDSFQIARAAIARAEGENR